MKIKTIKKTQTERILEIGNLSKRTSTTNRIHEAEERISGIEDMIEKIDPLVKENVKSKNFLTQNIQEIL